MGRTRELKCCVCKRRYLPDQVTTRRKEVFDTDGSHTYTYHVCLDCSSGNSAESIKSAVEIWLLEKTLKAQQEKRYRVFRKKVEKEYMECENKVELTWKHRCYQKELEYNDILKFENELFKKFLRRFRFGGILPAGG